MGKVVSLIDVSENKKIGLDFITVQIYAKQVLIVQQEVVVIIKQKMKSVHVLVSVQVICLVVMVNVDINKGIGRILIIVLMNVKQGLCVHLVVVVIVNQNMHRVHALNNAQEECLVVIVNVDTNKGIGRI